MAKFKAKMMSWNNQVFGNIFQRKKIYRALLRGIQKILSHKDFGFLATLEEELLLKVDEILHQEETFWKQKARANWINQGERNNKFFHASVVERRRRNRIVQLKKHDGSWSSIEEELQEMATSFYRQLYTKDDGCSFNSHHWRFPKLNRSNLQWLNREVSASEIKMVMDQIGNNKAPGPDSLPAKFFQKCWH